MAKYGTLKDIDLLPLNEKNIIVTQSLHLLQHLQQSHSTIPCQLKDLRVLVTT